MDQAVSGSEMNLVTVVTHASLSLPRLRTHNLHNTAEARNITSTKTMFKEETNGTSMESDPESDTFSESGEVSDLNADKLDPAERALYEKLKQQEREEREEIERELKEHEEAISLHSSHLRAREKEIHLVQERMQQRTERELDLSRPSSNKSMSNTSNGSSVNGCDSSNNNNNGSGSNGTKSNINNNKNSVMCGGGNNANNNNNNKHLGNGGGHMKNNCEGTLDMSKFLTEDFRAHFHNSANLLSTFPLGHPLAHAHLALGGHLLGREMKGLEMVNPFHPILPNHSAFPSPPSPAERYPPSSTTPLSPTGSLRPSPSPDDPNGENRSHNWTFEEQFKQVQVEPDSQEKKEGEKTTRTTPA
ncbi:hypothetical protein Btru_016791 [Bulinus truncatus]|nr:hypothetical protein Btru_016791 [Bulinus truncatus]